MRKVVVSTVVGALVLLGGTACDTTEGSGNVVTHTFELAPFSILEVGDSFVVNVTVGDTPSATVRIDDNLDDVLDVAVLDDVSTIGLDPDTDVVDATLEADVTVTGLEELGIAGASIVTLSDPLEAGTLALTDLGREPALGCGPGRPGPVGALGRVPGDPLRVRVGARRHPERRQSADGARPLDRGPRDRRVRCIDGRGHRDRGPLRRGVGGIEHPVRGLAHGDAFREQRRVEHRGARVSEGSFRADVLRPARAGSRRTHPSHARGSAARPGSAAWRLLPRRRPASRTPARSPRRGSSCRPLRSPGP